MANVVSEVVGGVVTQSHSLENGEGMHIEFESGLPLSKPPHGVLPKPKMTIWVRPAPKVPARPRMTDVHHLRSKMAKKCVFASYQKIKLSAQFSQVEVQHPLSFFL